MLSSLSLPAGPGRDRRPLAPRAVPLGSSSEQGSPCSTRSAISISVYTYARIALTQTQLSMQGRRIRRRRAGLVRNSG